MKTAPLAVLALLAATAACSDAPAGPARDRAPADAVVAGGDAGAPNFSRQPGGAPVVLHFRSIEDPDVQAEPGVCASAPFTANVVLAASLWSEAVTASGGRVVNNGVKQVGTATACIRITDPTFPPGLPQQFHARFRTEEGTFDATGACTLISNDVPQPGLVLGGCHLRVVDGPPAMAGGAVTSLSVFNPARLAGFATGSEWTVQFYPDR